MICPRVMLVQWLTAATCADQLPDVSSGLIGAHINSAIWRISFLLWIKDKTLQICFPGSLLWDKLEQIFLELLLYLVYFLWLLILKVQFFFILISTQQTNSDVIFLSIWHLKEVLFFLILDRFISYWSSLILNDLLNK